MAGFVTCGPNEALVVSGCCHRRPLMVPGGRVFVWPVIQKVQRITLNTMTLTIESPRVYTQQGVPISVTGIAQVKIQGQNSDMLRAACEQFLGKSEDEIMNVARETLEGHQRAIMASMTVEEIYKNRKKFSKKVFEVASSDLVDMGFTVVSYTIKDISDEEGYLKALGLARTAEVKRDARIGEAEAKRDALIKEALAEEERMAARYINDAEIAKAQRDFELKKAAYDVEVFSKKAESDLAYNLQAAKTRQRIKEEQMQVKVIERTQEIQVQEQEIARKEKELEATVRRPAEAEKYKLEKLAEAHRNKIIMEAEAEAEALRLRGEAEAFAIEAKAKAEAEQMAKKANAYKEYESAAKIDMVLDTLPKIAAEVAAPLAQCNKVVMVSHGNGDVGASKLTGEVLDIITKVHLTVSQLSGTPMSNSPGSILTQKKAEASKNRTFHRDREQYLSSTQRIAAQNRSSSQDSSPYSKPYHSYRTGDRRRNEQMSTKSSTRLASDERPRSAVHSEPIKIPAQERRNSAQEVCSKLPQVGLQSPVKRSERRSSSNGDIARVEKKTETNIEGKTLKLRLEELEDGEIEETNGLPSSTDANVSEVSAQNGDRVGSPVSSVSSSISSCNVQVQEALNRTNKGSARKGFLRGVVTTEQHDKQTKMLNAVRNANPKTGSGQQSSVSETTSSSIQTRINSRRVLPAPEPNPQPIQPSKEKAKKTFAMPLPPNSEKTVQQDLSQNSSQDESSTNSMSTPGTPKRKRRHYKGGTYGLFLSKKRKKMKENKKSKETESNADTRGSQEGEESSQSFAANSESEGDQDCESSISSNADNEDEHKNHQNEEPEILVNDELVDVYVEEVSQEEVVNDCDEIPLNVEENVSQEVLEITDEKQKQENDTIKTNDSMSSPKKGGTTTQSSSSSIIDSVKNRPRSKRRVEGPEAEPEPEPENTSPPSSVKSKSEEQKRSTITISNGPPQTSNEESPKQLRNGSAVRENFRLPANSATPSVVQNPNRKTLLKISTAGSIESGDTHGTYLGVEQSKFVMINDSKSSQSATCLCSSKPLINSSEISKGKPMFCQAIDCFDEKLIGCCNQVRLTSLFRSSKRVPYRILCEVHLARLRRHHCCPGCGLFCTQGEFLECFCVKKQIHLFHKKCQIDKPLEPKNQRCLHCDNVSLSRSVRLEMNGPLNNNTYYLQQTSILKPPKARISMIKRKGKQMDRVLEDFEEPGIEYIIPVTKKTLSLAGIPLGPQRKQLEDLLTTLDKDKQSPNIRITIQHNKNFYAVAKSGEIEKVLAILAQGFDPNYPYEDNDNETPLHAASSSGHLLVVHLLIQSGANPNVLNKNMTTPIIQAIENKHNAVVKYLINAGASLDIRGEDGMTSLHIAAKSGNIEAVHHIVNSGKMNVNLQDDGGWSALVWATEHKHYNIVKLLVSKGADPNIEDDEENIGLHWAAFSGDTNIALLFLEMGSNVINQTNMHGDTPLHIASRRDNHECVVLLLSRGADISLMNKNNETPLQCAQKDSESAVVLRVNQELKRFSIRRTLNSEKLIHRDLSKGKEYYQIQVVNGVDNEPYPIDFMYVTENCEASQINIDRTITSLQSCQCEDDCTSQKCVCSAISFRCWYDKEGKLLPEFNLMDAPMIFECNRACSCWKSCNNRVVQYGVRYDRSRLQVFRTKGKGWGVRALRDIPRGTFVCEYVGEIISDSEADRREDDSYLFDLDNKDGETYCLDARFYGNICRFINHLCSPNLIPVKVFVDHQDLSFPRIALFSSRDIKAFEELGFDYGEKFWVIKYKWFTCSCGSQNCKYNKQTIHSTIESYYKRLREEQISIASPSDERIETI